MANGDNFKKGFLAVIASMVIWGVLPVYWQQMQAINSWVIVLYRILLMFICVYIAARLQFSVKEIFAPLKEKGVFKKFFFAGLLSAANWSIFIYAVNSNQIVQSSIGYYLEPLLICLVGNIVFHEKFNKYNITAILLATVSVVVLLVHFGQLPTIALVLAGTFTIYTIIKKTTDLPVRITIVYELMALAPPVLAAIIYLECTGQGALAVATPYTYGLLLMAGLFTLIPFLLFGYAAQRVPMFYLGLAEYIAPSLSLLLGLAFLGESIDGVQLFCFVLIWIGLIIFSYGEYRQFKKLKATEIETEDE